MKKNKKEAKNSQAEIHKGVPVMKRIMLIVFGCAVLISGCSIHVFSKTNPEYAQPYEVTPEQAEQNDLDTQQYQVQAQVVYQQPAVVMQANVQPQYEEPRAESEAVNNNQIWVQAYVVADDIIIPGFWRPRIKAGFTWVDGYWQAGIYIPGFWRPVQNHRNGYVWVPGFWYGGHWMSGRWRQAYRNGFVWIHGHWNNKGEWIFAHWQPRFEKRGYVWEPGHWSRNGRWLSGKWRVQTRKGYCWVPGRYTLQGGWIAGRWRYVPKGKIWFQGYWNRNGQWVKGGWRVQYREGYTYRNGHYNPQGQWLPGHWESKHDQAKPQTHYGTGYYDQGKNKRTVRREKRGNSKVRDTVEKREALKEQPAQAPKHQKTYRQIKNKQVVVKNKTKGRTVVVKKEQKTKKIRVKSAKTNKTANKTNQSRKTGKSKIKQRVSGQ